MVARVPIEQLLGGARPTSAEPAGPEGPASGAGPGGAVAEDRAVLQKLVLALLAIPEVRAEIMLALRRRGAMAGPGGPAEPAGPAVSPTSMARPRPGGFAEALQRLRSEE